MRRRSAAVRKHSDLSPPLLKLANRLWLLAGIAAIGAGQEAKPVASRMQRGRDGEAWR